MLFRPYIAIFVNFQETNSLTKMENTETCNLTQFIEYIVSFLPLNCDFLNFQEINPLTKMKKHRNMRFNPVYRAYYVICDLILQFSDFLWFGVWIRCSSRFKIYFRRPRNKVLSNPLQPQDLKRAHRKMISKNVFDGTYRVI